MVRMCRYSGESGSRKGKSLNVQATGRNCGLGVWRGFDHDCAMANLIFQQLNMGWNAHPNVPHPIVETEGVEIRLLFVIDPYKQLGRITFRQASRWRLGSTNDHGWYLGQCRYSSRAPRWGEFYELVGDDPARLLPGDWVVTLPENDSSRHFLFYLRDDTFECLADDYEVEFLEWFWAEHWGTYEIGYLAPASDKHHQPLHPHARKLTIRFLLAILIAGFAGLVSIASAAVGLAFGLGVDFLGLFRGVSSVQLHDVLERCAISFVVTAPIAIATGWYASRISQRLKPHSAH